MLYAAQSENESTHPEPNQLMLKNIGFSDPTLVLSSW